MIKRAVCLVRQEPHYRRQAFVDGLMRAGYTLHDHIEPGPSDVLVVWNLSGHGAAMAAQFRKAGARVLVAENGYIGADAQGQQLYALALGGHNGSGTWPQGGPERWAALCIEPAPWRAHGTQIVVRGQRGIGSPEMASPPSWHQFAARRLERAAPKRWQIIQEHTGKPACHAAAAADIDHALIGAHAMCIWASAAGVRALVKGVPVFYDAPHWICEQAAVRGIENVEHPRQDDGARARALRALAWAQWSAAELASGEPFVQLLGMPRE